MTDVKKITLGFIVGWALGVLAVISGITSIFTQPLVGILFLLTGFILLPPANKLIKEKFKFSISGGLKFILVIVLLIIIGTLISGEKSQSPQSESKESEQKTQEALIEISAVQLSEEYDENSISADAKYKGKKIKVSGIIKDIGKDILDTPYIVLEGSQNVFFGVQCMFSREDEAKLASLSKGQRITLICEVSGEMIGDVVLRGCTEEKQSSAVKEVPYRIIEKEDISYAGCKRIGIRIVVPDDANKTDVDYTLKKIVDDNKSKWDNITVWAYKYSEEKQVGKIANTMGMKEYSVCD